MDDTLTKTASKANARYKAEIEKAMAEIRQHEATFDRLHAEIVAMQEAAERKDAQSAALTQEINRMMKVIWGPKESHAE